MKRTKQLQGISVVERGIFSPRDRQTLADWNTTTPDTAKTYWANGLLKSADNTISKSDYAYSAKNQLTSETQTLAGQAAKLVSYDYDADGLRMIIGSPSGSPVNYEWTAKGQLDNLNRDIALNPPPPDLAEYAYDKAGRLDTLTHENGIVQDLDYDAASQLQSRIHKQGATTVAGHKYVDSNGDGYDLTGRRTLETFPGTSTPARTYGYDTADQVTNANYGSGQTDSYNYDAAANRSTATIAAFGGTATTYTANSANQYTSITGMSAPVHDANGNLTSQNGVTYAWDSENRLLSVSDGTTINTFTYDAQHRRVTKRTAVSGTVTNKVHYVYDGWNVIEERTNTDTTPGFDLTTFALTKTQTWGTDLSGSLQGAGGVGGLLMVEEIGTTTAAYHFQYDGNGNVTEITDHTGAKAATYRYDAFGNTLVATGSYAATNKYRFSTKPLDDEIANAPLYYYGYRYYGPRDGRWPSRDPIEENGGINLYGFCYNNSFGWYDYLGWNPQPIDFDAWRKGARKSSNDANRRNNRGDPEGYDTNEEPKAQDSTPGNKRGDCCGGKWGAKEFIDSAGKKCCDFQVSTIEIRSRYSDARTRNTGHTWIMINGGAPGLYPNGRPIGSHSDWNAWHWNPVNRDKGKGKTANDRHPDDYDASTTYKICPETYSLIMDSINDHSKDNWALNNIAARNCTGWACQRIMDGGLLPPFDPNGMVGPNDHSNPPIEYIPSP